MKPQFTPWLRLFAVLCLSTLFAGLLATPASAQTPGPWSPIANGWTLASGAYDGSNFLLGLETDTTNAKVAVQLVSQSLATIGSPIALGRNGQSCCISGLAFDGTNYLVAWEEDQGIKNASHPFLIYGQFISTSGVAVRSTFALTTAGIFFDGMNRLVYGGGKYLLTYTRMIDPSKGENPSNTYVAGRLVSPDGTLGNEFRISAGSGSGGSVAFDGTNFLVAWEQASTDRALRARFVSPAGVPGLEFSLNVSLVMDGSAPITLIANSTNYLVVWTRAADGSQGRQVQARRVSFSGELVGNVVTIESSRETRMAMGVTTDGSNYLIVWTQLNGDSYGQYLNSAGVPVGSKAGISVGAGQQLIAAFCTVTKCLGFASVGTVIGPGGPSQVGVVNGAVLTNPTTPANPLPTLLSVSPDSATAGAGPVSITVTGSNFIQNSVVQLNTTALATTYVNSTKLNAVIPASSLTSAGSMNISVVNPPSGGGTSSTVTFTVSLSTSINPSTKPLPILEVETGSVRSGYMILTPDSGSAIPTAFISYGMVQDGGVQSKAGILSTPLTTSATGVVEVIGGIGRNLGIALVNPGATTNVVTMTLRDMNGGIVGTPATVTLDPYKQVAKFISELFSSTVIGTSFIGSINLQSATPFAPMGLTFTGPTFGTVALGSVASTAAVPVRSLSGGSIGGAGSMIFPQFAYGGGWATQVSIVNSGSTTMTGRIDFLGGDGSPVTLKFNGSSKSSFTYSIPAGGTLIFAPRDQNGQSPL